MTGFNFKTVPARRRTENVVPMINVVFLLLIFFLISAQIAPPPPLEVIPAQTVTGNRHTPQENTLWIDEAGTLALGNARNEDVWPKLQNIDGTLYIQASAALRAREMARLLARIGSIGIDDVTLITSRKDGS